jgi:prolyl oligopeptidase
MTIFSTGSVLRVCCFVLGAANAIDTDAAPAYPATAKHSVSDAYHGISVTDDYRWLEEDASSDVKRWVTEQNSFTRYYLDAIPQRAAIAERVGALLRTAPVRRFDFQYRARLFALKIQPPKNQAVLVVLPPSGDVRAERVVLDPDTLDASGHTAIDFFTPS